MFPALSDKTLALSEKVAHATMGIDALYRQETGAESDREGLVVVQMAEVSPTPFASYGEAQEYLADLAQQALPCRSRTAGCTTPRHALPCGLSAPGVRESWNG